MNFRVEPITNREYHLIQSELVKGSLVYQSWFSISKAKIWLKSFGEFYAAQKSIWKSDFYIMQNDKAVLEFNLNWRGSVQINSYFKEKTQKYILKRKRFWNTNYLLIDENNTEICMVTSEFNWKKFKKSYQINSLSNKDSMPNEVLCLSLIHCIILINTRAAAAT